MISGGLIISLVGVWLSWTALPIEIMGDMAEDGLLPETWRKLSRNGASAYAIVLTTLYTDVFLLSSLFADSVYNFAYALGTAVIFLTWLLLGLY